MPGAISWSAFRVIDDAVRAILPQVNIAPITGLPLIENLSIGAMTTIVESACFHSAELMRCYCKTDSGLVRRTNLSSFYSSLAKLAVTSYKLHLVKIPYNILGWAGLAYILSEVDSAWGS